MAAKRTLLVSPSQLKPTFPSIYRNGKAGPNNRMSLRNKDIRFWNLRYLADSMGGIPKLSERLGKDANQIRHLIGKTVVKGIGDRLALEIESSLSKPEGWLDTPHPRLWASIENPKWGFSARQVASKVADEAASYSADVAPGPPIVRLPVLPWDLACKPHAKPDHQGREFVMATVEVSERAFALRVQSDSMVSASEGASFSPGSTIIVDPAVAPRHGSFVMAVEGENESLVFRQLQIEGNKQFLKPLNARYPITELQPTGYICGVVVQMLMSFT